MKSILITILLFSSALLNSCDSESSKKIAKTKTQVSVEEYRNTDFRYSVNVKSVWKRKIAQQEEGFLNVLWDLPPIRSKYSSNFVSVNMGVEATKNWTFEEAVSNSKEELRAVSYYFQWDEKSNSGVFQYGDPKRQLKGKCYFLKDNNIVYRLTFSANKDTYDHYISEFEHFCKTFKIINN